MTVTLTPDERAALLDHAMWLHNAGVSADAVLYVAQKLVNWCECVPKVHPGGTERGVADSQRSHRSTMEAA